MGNMPQLMQMQSMQQQNQLNQMTMQEKQRGQQEMNALRRLDPSSATYLQDVKQINPKMGFEFEKMQQDAKSADTEGQIKKVKLLTDKLALLPDAYRRADTPEAYLALHHSIHADPVVGSWLKSTGATLESGLETIKNAVDTGKFNELRTGSMQSVSQLLDSLKPLIVPANASVYAGGAFKQAPAAPDKVSAPTELTKYEDELDELMRTNPNSPRVANLRSKINKLVNFAPPAVTTVKLAPLESAEQKGKGELNVKTYGTISDAARLATRTLPSLETQSNILDRGFKTGFGTDVQKAGASVLASLGVPEAARFATDSQTFLASTQAAVLQRQLEQKGPQTESDAQRITQTGAQLGNTPEANRFLIDVAKGQYKRDIEQRSFFDKWWSQNKTYEGAEDAWYAGDGGKSLFDRPELKKYAPKAATSSARSAADAILGKGKVP
jgi:hypothetical protein